MRYTKFNKIPNTVLIFVLMAPFASLFYLLYILNSNNIENPYLYGVQLFADIIAIISVMSLWVTIILDLLQPEQDHSEFIYSKNWVKKIVPL